jgi:uncharacterized protein YbaR (Trm112 family)
VLDPELLKILCCPETHQALRLAEASLLDKLNEQVVSGKLVNNSGSSVKERLEAGLVRADGKLLYPIRQGLPVMLVNEAIPLN